MAGPYEEITISPQDIHGQGLHRPVVWEEDTDSFYFHGTKEFRDALEQIDRGIFDPLKNNYIYRWSYKGDEVRVRMDALPGLYKSIKSEGVKTPVCVEATGERLDGSFRTKIAMHLGIKHVPARLYTADWRDVSSRWLINKLKARALSSGVDYYRFQYGDSGWWNVPPERSPVYEENASERWDIIKDLLVGSVLDLGCNEGFMTINAARRGHTAHGIDHDWIHIANLNRLIYSWLDKADIPVAFEQGDLADAPVQNYDTVLALNVLYHLDRNVAKDLLRRAKGKNVIIQCNLRKERERSIYYGSHPDDMKKMLEECDLEVVEEIKWKDKPIIIAK